MSAELWHEKYLGVVAGYTLYGQCAACDYEGPVDDFRVWHRRGKQRVLCNQCSSDVTATMQHEGWEPEER